MIYIIADVHGNTRRFDSIMEQIGLRESDTLYVLGDVIDRYPDGIRLLRRLMAMPNAKLLLGNHEHMMLECLDREYDESDPAQLAEKEKNFRRWYRNGGGVTHAHIKRLKKSLRRRIFDYLRALPLNYDVELNGQKYKLVHGAPVEDYPKYRDKYGDETFFAVWMRWDGDHVPDGDYTMIFGHTPTDRYLPGKTLRVFFAERMIGIDCGCCFPGPPPEDEELYGRLACLRLDDMKVFYSEEINTEKTKEG
ncbi:MAG: metallophosphoesterase [Clostridia bacterium]|nr:metallophosphoesterase [Clostridia bacterium]